MLFLGALVMIVRVWAERLPGAEHCLANAACRVGAQLVAPFVNIHFLGSSLTFMMVYVWGRRNEHVRMSFLGLFPFTAPYLPWVLFSFSILLGNSATTDLIGIIVGHMYYFLEGGCFALVLHLGVCRGLDLAAQRS